MVDAGFWHGKRVFLTGHTGFKGGWLSLWLQAMGARVKGFALEPPTAPNLFVEARISSGMASQIGDIRQFETLRAGMADFEPEIIFHLAAQPLVRLSYQEPVVTYTTNVMGTVHVLEAARHLDSLRCIVNVTTDKCYENREHQQGYREDEPLGGYDPYSSSKGCAELVTSAYRRSYFQHSRAALASARAGNVIGGGDWALDRLVPDILAAFERDEAAIIRSPHAVRPWQHVLEPLSGYLVLAQQLWQQGQQVAEAWNFGPEAGDAQPVQAIVEQLARNWGGTARWQLDHEPNPHEATYLKLDISKAGNRLTWQPRWNLEAALKKTVFWRKAWLAGEDMRAHCIAEIEQYMRSPRGEIR